MCGSHQTLREIKIENSNFPKSENQKSKTSKWQNGKIGKIKTGKSRKLETSQTNFPNLAAAISPIKNRRDSPRSRRSAPIKNATKDRIPCKSLYFLIHCRPPQ